MTDGPTCRSASESSHAQRAGTDAFTLIELLVVIAVIAILAALLLPSLYGGKVEADSAVCKSNLHQLTVAMALYIQDNGAYPGANDSWYQWPAKFQPYLRSPYPEPNILYNQNGDATSYLGPRESVWACPAYNHLGGAFMDDTGDGGWADGRAAYGYNSSGLAEVDAIGDPNHPGYALPLGLGGGPFGPTRESQVVVPSDMMAIGDAFMDQNPLGGHIFLDEVFLEQWLYNQLVTGVPPGNPAIRAMQQRHWGKFNIGFCDGHVESLRTNDLINLNNSAVAARWNNDHQPHNQHGFELQ